MKKSEIGFQDPPEWLEGFDIELVKELDQLVRAYGVDDPKVAVRRYQVDSPERVCVSVSITPHVGVMICLRPGIVNIANSFLRRFGDDAQSYVIWEQGITVEQVRAMVSGLRTMAGLFGPNVEQALGGLEPGDNQEECLHSVDEQFELRGYLALPVHGSPEKLLSLFDHPEELMVFEAAIGRGVIRRCDLAYAQQREKLVQMLLNSYGVSRDMIPQLAPGELLKIYRVVDSELSRVSDQID